MKWWILFLVGCVIVPIGTVAIAKQSFSQTYLFSLPPRYYDYNWIYMLGSGRISGDFSENNGQPVNFYVFDQQEFDAYRASGVAASLFSLTNVPSGTYRLDVQLGGRYYLVTISASAQTTELVTENFTVAQTSLPYLGLESLVGVGTILIIGSFRVRVREYRRLVSVFVKANPNFGPGHGEADDRILASAKDLCRQLGFSYEPLRLHWIAWLKLGGVRAVPSDVPLIGVKGKGRGTVFMPAAIRGRLEPNEWAPLVGVSLIHGFNPSIRPRVLFLRRLWLLILASVATALAAFVALDFVFPVNDFSERLLFDALIPILFVLGGLVLGFSARKINMVNRKYLLDADRIAAQIMGKDRMLETLKKIDAMNLSDIEERNREKPTIWKRAGVLPFPSLTQRIQQLETTWD